MNPTSNPTSGVVEIMGLSIVSYHYQMWDVVWDGVTTQADYVHNPTIVGFSFSSPTSLQWEVSKTETLSILCVHLAYVDIKTLLQRGYFLVGLLDA